MPNLNSMEHARDTEAKRAQFEENLKETFRGRRVEDIVIKDGSIYLKFDDEMGLQIELAHDDPGDIPEVTVNSVGLNDFNVRERYER